ncbi:MAG TPA: hypothetical protein VGM88_04575 [Kofleriaceae bacterium]|jgi:hypothetical protein
MQHHATLITVLTIVGVMLLTVVVLIVSTRRNLPRIMSAQTAFFTETGYRHPEIPGAPIEEQVKFVPKRGNVMAMALEKKYVKPDAAGPIAFESSSRSEGRNRVQRESWRMTLPRPPAIRFQIAERSLLPSVGKAIGQHLTGRTRSWSQHYPTNVEIDDAAIAKRFAVFGEDPDAVRAVLAQAAIRERLLDCAEVDLVVDGGSILLSDPNGKNLAAGRTQRRGLDPSPTIRASIPVHRKIHAMLGAVRDAIA